MSCQSPTHSNEAVYRWASRATLAGLTRLELAEMRHILEALPRQAEAWSKAGDRQHVHTLLERTITEGLPEELVLAACEALRGIAPGLLAFKGIETVS